MNKLDLIKTLSTTNGLSKIEASRIVNITMVYLIAGDLKFDLST